MGERVGRPTVRRRAIADAAACAGAHLRRRNSSGPAVLTPSARDQTTIGVDHGAGHVAGRIAGEKRLPAPPFRKRSPLAATKRLESHTGGGCLSGRARRIGVDGTRSKGVDPNAFSSGKASGQQPWCLRPCAALAAA